MRSFVGEELAGRYRLERFLDEGAFGAVYQGTHRAFGAELRQVAVKLSKRPIDDAEARDIFGDALLLARIADRSPDITARQHFVTVHDAGRCEEAGALCGHCYMVMELVRGGSLGRCLRAGPFPLRRALDYYDQILTAVAYMHRGMVDESGRSLAIAHRDLKPGNILVAKREGAPDLIKVSDFGLAVKVDTLLGWVESGGDLAYMAPESFSHNLCSPQSDVYSLALVFYEMLTCRTPFEEVGRHLGGSSQENRDELRRLHLTARRLERFPVLDSHEELRRRPALAQVLRQALTLEMSSRPYTNALELQQAWEEAKRGHAALREETPWELVTRLTGEADQCFAVDDVPRGMTLLEEAMAANRDRGRLSDAMAVGRTYLLMVERLIARGETEAAGAMATEGYQRRQCRSTCLAMTRYYAALRSPLAARYQQEASMCTDRD